MTAYIFQSLAQRGAKVNITPDLTPKSIQWFRSAARTASATPTSILKSDAERIRKLPMIGQMFLFGYDPKHKATLPYYDIFPLVIPIDSIRTQGRATNGNGFMGLNLHYLPLRERGMLMDALYKYISNTALDETTRLKVSYRLLKRVSRAKYFKPCLKQYLFGHVQSHQFYYIDPKEWDMALFLPLARFKKAQISQVHRESLDVI